MNSPPNDQGNTPEVHVPQEIQTTRKPLRIWPGVVAALLLVVFRFGAPELAPHAEIFGMPLIFVGLLAAMVCILAIVVWWLFFSRLRWVDRLGGLALIVLTLWVTYRLVHESIRGGSMGYLMPVLAVPIMALALVGWAVVIRFSNLPRRISLAITIVAVCLGFTLIRTGGLSTTFDNDFHWRWSKTHEEKLLESGDETTQAGAVPLPATVITGADWPGFRGPLRDGIVRGSQIKTDWSASPPVEMWRQPIGPGWSSFAVQSGRIFTQEQRGDHEVVSCYDLSTGKPVWKHRDVTRFYESNAGSGPRATPTINNGRVYSLGATGILNVLDAGTGAEVWSRNTVNDTGAKIPHWGIAGSPLVLADMVVIAAAGKLAAYDLASGKPRWNGPTGGGSYSSPQLVTIGGVQQIVLLSAAGATGVAPADGAKLWEHAWEGVPIVQPNVTDNGDLLIAVSESSGTRRLAVAQGGNGWTTQERWTTEELNPYFNDFVVLDGHAYGFNGNSLVSIDLADGKLKWKGGGFGNGQLILLTDQKLLLVLSEQGELGIVKADPHQFTELARIPAIKGKTWNHPVLAGDVVLVRNAEEMAAFKLALAR